MGTTTRVARGHGSHAGDNPPLFARADKTVNTTFRTDAYTVSELLAADVAVVIHAAADNFANIPSDRYESAPVAGGPVPDAMTLDTGDSGGRIACGVVRAGTPIATSGYWLGARDGGVFTFGSAAFKGSAGALPLKAPIVGMHETPSRNGYWLGAADGGVFAFGDAPFLGSEASVALKAPVVGITSPDVGAVAPLINTSGVVIGEVGFTQLVRIGECARRGDGDRSGAVPWFPCARRRSVHSGTPTAFSSAGGHYNPAGPGTIHGAHAGDNPSLFARADKTVSTTFTTDAYTVAELLAADVAVVVHAGRDNFANIPSARYATIGGGLFPDQMTRDTGDSGGRIACGVVRPVGPGYWMATKDGGVFTHGSLSFFGSDAALPLRQPIVGIASTPTGRGYWTVSADGGVFTHGDALFVGSAGDLKLNAPIVAFSPTPSGRGYTLFASDGGVFDFGDAEFYGSAATLPLRSPIVGGRLTDSGAGYYLTASDGGVFTYGDAGFRGSTGNLDAQRSDCGSRTRTELIGSSCAKSPTTSVLHGLRQRFA